MEIDANMLSMIKRMNSGDYAVYSVENGALITLQCSQGLYSLSDMTEEEYNDIIEKDAVNIVLESDRPAVAAKLAELLQCTDESAVFILTYRIINKIHDIRTPINAIMNMAAFAKEDMNDHKKLLHDLDGIESSNTFLLSLINDVLDISKIDSGAIELHPEPYPYDEYINNIRSIFEPMCKQHDRRVLIPGD